MVKKVKRKVRVVRLKDLKKYLERFVQDNTSLRDATVDCMYAECSEIAERNERKLRDYIQ